MDHKDPSLYEKFINDKSYAYTMDFITRGIIQYLHANLSENYSLLDSYWIDICAIDDESSKTKFDMNYKDINRVYKLFECANLVVAKEIFEYIFERERKHSRFSTYLSRPKLSIPETGLKFLVFCAVKDSDQH